MKEFVSHLASVIVESNSHKKKSGFNLGRTIALTVFTNLISLPFGRISFSMARDRQKSATEIIADINTALYAEFAPGMFAESEAKAEGSKKRELYEKYLDTLNEQQKTYIITAALQDKKNYKIFVDKWIWDLAAKKVA